MTKATGAMVLRRRREELFSAEMTLRRTMMHLSAALAWSCESKDYAANRAQADALHLVRGWLCEITKEQADLR